MFFPPIEEQQAIADYLDEKNAEIDKNISLIGKKIEAYKRLKKSLSGPKLGIWGMMLIKSY